MQMMYISRIQLQQIHFMQATKTYHMHQFGNLDECVVSLDAPCSLGLSATSQQYFSLTTNQPPPTSQQCSSLRTNQHQPSATSQPNRLPDLILWFTKLLNMLVDLCLVLS
jgi:hypothetical protein